jgi:hypothetical protein
VQNVELAVRGLARLNAGLAAEGKEQSSLVLAGGYDERLLEARQYMQELRLLIDELGLAKQVSYLGFWLYSASGCRLAHGSGSCGRLYTSWPGQKMCEHGRTAGLTRIAGAAAAIVLTRHKGHAAGCRDGSAVHAH